MNRSTHFARGISRRLFSSKVLAIEWKAQYILLIRARQCSRPTKGTKMQQATVYHLYVRRSNGSRARLTVTPETKERANVLFSKLSAPSQAAAFILPADPSDTVIPEAEL